MISPRLNKTAIEAVPVRIVLDGTEILRAEFPL
jgi:hypothetical protein